MSDELCFIRCITCNKILGNKWEKYQELLESGVSIEKALNELGLTRPCCRIRMRNPIKVVDRNVQSQADIDKLFENNFETLSVSNDYNASTEGALSAMSSSSMTIIPEEETDIELPPLPDISKLSIKSSTGNNLFRTYRAW